MDSKKKERWHVDAEGNGSAVRRPNLTADDGDQQAGKAMSAILPDPRQM
jgi:hypothetical protein